MKLTAKGRYAVMAMADLAAQGEGACESLSDIALRQGISVTFLEQLFVKLRRAKLVESRRGAQGGYSLAVSASLISLDRIIHAVDIDIKAHGCTPQDRVGCTGKTDRCLTHNLWGALENHIEGFLASVTLQDVITENIPLFPKAISSSLEVAE